MKLTEKEQELCNKYGAHDKDGFVHCHECPLVIPGGPYDCHCYATVEEGSVEAKELKRY